MVDASLAEFLAYVAVFGVIVLVAHWVARP